MEQKQRHYRLHKKICHSANTFDYLYFDQSRIIYPLAKQLIILNIQSQDYTSITLHQHIEEIKKIAIGGNKKFIICIEKIDNAIYLSLYSLGGQRKFIKIQNKNIQIACTLFLSALTICQQQPSIIGIATLNTQKIMFFDIIKQKLIVYNQHANSIAMHPKNSQLIAACGDQFLQIIGINEGNIELITDYFQKIDLNQHFQQIFWMQWGILVVGEKLIYLLNDKYSLMDTFKSNQVIMVKTFSKGFLISYPQGKFRLYIKTQQKYKFYQTLNVNFERNSNVHSIQFSSQQDSVLIVQRNRDVSKFKIQQINYQNFYKPEEERVKSITPDYVFNNSGEIGISKIALCRDKPLIAILSKNIPILTIFNLESMSCQAKRFFNMKYSVQLTAIHSICFHPQGYQICLGFSDKLRLYYVLLNDLILHKQLNIKNVYSMKYSQHGNYLGVYQHRNKNHTFAIYQTHKWNFICSMKIVSEVLSMQWLSPLNIIVAVAQGLYDFNISKEIQLPLLQPFDITDFAVNTLMKKKLFISKNRLCELNKKNQLTKLCNLGMNKIFCIGGLYLGVGLNGNMIYSNSCIFDNNENLQVHIGQFQILGATQSKWVITYNQEGYTASNLICLETKEEEDVPPLCLLRRSSLEQYIKKFKSLENQLQSLNNDILIKQEQQRKDMHKEKQKYVTAANRQLQGWSKRYQQIRDNKIVMQKQAIGFFKHLQIQQLKSIQQLQKLYQGKLSIQKQKYIQLEQRAIQERLKNQSRYKHLQSIHQTQINKIRGQYQQSLNSLYNEFQLSKNRNNNVKKQYEQVNYQLQQQYQRQIRGKDLNYQKDKQQMRNRMAIMGNQIDQGIAKIKNLEQEETKLCNILKVNQQELELLKLNQEEFRNKVKTLENQRSHNIQVLQEREQTIKSLNQKITDLQKSKHVLSFRTTEMRRQLQPKEEQIQKLKQQLFRLQSELQKIGKSQFKQKEKVFKLQKQLESLRKQNASVFADLKQKQQWINKMVLQIHNLVNKDQKQWAKQIIRIYQAYVKGKQVHKNGQDKNIQFQLTRQLVHLQKTLNQVSQSSKKQASWRDKQVAKKLKENADLIFDLNELRKNNDYLQRRLKQQKQLIKNYQLELSTVKRPATTGALQRKFRKKTDALNESMFQSVSNQNESQIGYKTNQFRQSYYTRQSTKQRALSKKGSLRRGTNYDLIKLNDIQKKKIFDFMNQVQIYQHKIKEQQETIQNLNDQLRNQ